MAETKHIKENFDQSNIAVDIAPSITERILHSCMCHECVIENYSKLKEKIFYSMTGELEILGRTLKLYKTKTTHSFRFHCELRNTNIQNMSTIDLTGKIEFYIAYDEDKIVCMGELDETDYGFSIDVPNTVIVDPINKYLKENDKLVIQFRYRKFYYPRASIVRSGISTWKDADLLSKDLLALYKSKKFADFAIIDKDGKKHLVHKWICKSRSATVNNIKGENVIALTVKGESRHVEIVIRYMYGGILPDLSVDDLLKVLVVAEELDIEFLILSIRYALIENLNKYNAQQIYKITMNYADMHEVAYLAKGLMPQETENKHHRRIAKT